MPSPFPGMDPYLEHPELWPNVHHGLISALRDILVPLLRPRYWVTIEERTYITEPEEVVVVGRPDVSVVEAGIGPSNFGPSGAVAVAEPLTALVPMPEEVREAYLEVRLVETREVVTVLEILSPTNKRPGEGQRLYLEKRLIVLGSLTHCVEIDLLRGGERPPLVGERVVRDYRMVVSRAERRPRVEVYPFGVREPIPRFRLPLRMRAEEPVVDLQRIVGELYDRAGYDLVVAYGREPVPPLRADDAVWADALLREKGLR